MDLHIELTFSRCNVQCDTVPDVYELFQSQWVHNPERVVQRITVSTVSLRISPLDYAMKIDSGATALMPSALHITLITNQVIHPKPSQGLKYCTDFTRSLLSLGYIGKTMNQQYKSLLYNQLGIQTS